MKIRYFSDLHIDPQWFLPFDPPVLDDDNETTLVLAGDIAEYKHVSQFVLDMSRRFKYVVYVMGNHEFYRTSITRAIPKIKGKITQLNDNKYPDNIHILEDEYVILDDVAFIGATLWASMGERDPFTMYNAKTRMNDYKCIRMPRPGAIPTGQGAYGSKLTPEKTVDMHYNSRYFIIDAAQTLAELPTVRKIVVVTHHGVTNQSIQPSFRGDGLNGAYVSELSDFIGITKIDLMIHGHVHHTFDYNVMIGEDDPYPTRVVTNPRGYRMIKYPNQIENYDFNPIKVIEL